EQAQHRRIQKGLYLVAEGAVAIPQLPAQRVHFLGPLEVRQPSIEVQLLRFVRNVLVRDVRRAVDGDFGGGAGLLGPLPLELADGLVEEAHVRIEADRLDEAGLRGPENVARPAELEVAQRDAEAAPELGV